jgi:creatinine amidohydrolase
MNRRIWEMTFEEVRDYLKGGCTGVVIPFGIVEPHGPHLPMGTDTLLALGFSEKIAEKFGWLISAPMNYGINNTLSLYPGATTIKDETYAKFVMDMIEGFIRTGFKHVICNNGHGPNMNPIQEAAKELSGKYPHARIFIIEWWMLDRIPLQHVYGDKSPGHAGIDETAAVLHFFPGLVKPERLDKRGTWIREDGFKTYPAPASCHLNDEASMPEFDTVKAKNFTEEVIELIYKKIESALDGFEYNLGDEKK